MANRKAKSKKMAKFGFGPRGAQMKATHPKTKKKRKEQNVHQSSHTHTNTHTHTHKRTFGMAHKRNCVYV